MAVTIYDIAQRANMSHTTVSMALRNLPSVKKNTRERIQNIAREMGYRPNQVAVSLKSGVSKRIALMIPELDVTMNSKLIISLEHQCNLDGYEVVLMQVSKQADKMRRSMEHMLQGGYAAAVLLLYDFMPVADLINDFLAEQHPVVIVGEPKDLQPRPGLYRISVDNSSAVRDTIKMLIALGHRNIVHSIVRSAVAGSTPNRIIRETMAEHGITGWEPEFYYHGDNHTDYIRVGYQAARILFEQKPGVTAIQCQNDLFAYGLMRGLKELGVRVPDDISISASDNTELGEYYPVSMTSIDMRLQETAITAWNLLSAHFSEPDWETVPGETILRSSLIVRETTGIVPQKPFSTK